MSMTTSYASIPCLARCANGYQCQRLRQTGQRVCSTHKRACLYGYVDDGADKKEEEKEKEEEEKKKEKEKKETTKKQKTPAVPIQYTVEVFVQNIQGICYFLDTRYPHVYCPESILARDPHPRILGRYRMESNNHFVIEFM